MYRGICRMPALVKQVGFCLVCGNSIHSDDEFEKSERGACHDECLENGSEQDNTVDFI